LGTPPDLREILFCADGIQFYRAEIGNEVASASAFPSATWERGKLRIAVLLGVVWCGLTALTAGADNQPPALQSVTFHGQAFLVRTVDPKKEDLRLFWKDDKGNLLRDFTGLEKAVSAKGEKLVFAANAGMFEPDLRPVGLLMQDGNEKSPLNLKDGTGNFYMKPNGVFLINEKHEALVVDSSAYAALLTPVTWATQSGPMLVHGGDITPDFIEDSKNLKIRSGVGVRKEGTIVFALSRGPVNFYTFASLFLNRLKCPNALFLDGDISAFYVPGEKDTVPHTFGPMLGVVKVAP
jgi:uncharacterized protein YigE (DUF2233 family)